MHAKKLSTTEIQQKLDDPGCREFVKKHVVASLGAKGHRDLGSLAAGEPEPPPGPPDEDEEDEGDEGDEVPEPAPAPDGDEAKKAAAPPAAAAAALGAGWDEVLMLLIPLVIDAIKRWLAGGENE